MQLQPMTTASQNRTRLIYRSLLNKICSRKIHTKFQHVWQIICHGFKGTGTALIFSELFLVLELCFEVCSSFLSIAEQALSIIVQESNTFIAQIVTSLFELS